MFKKTAIAALVLGFSGAASAAMYAPAPAPACAAGNVTVPCERSAWDLGVDALYMRSIDNVTSGLNSNLNKRADMGWGFRLEGSYHFGTGNDVNLNWTHFDRKTDNIINGTAAALNIDVKNKLDLVNFEFGQQVDFGENVDVRFHAGVQYAHVEDDLVSRAAAGNGTTDFKATGFGPRVGAMVKYDFGNGFGVYVDSAIALLEAKLEMSSNVVPVGVTLNSYTTVLSTDSSVGVAYTHAMAQGDLTARLGWGVKQLNSNQAGINGAGYSGVNLGLKWVGNA